MGATIRRCNPPMARRGPRAAPPPPVYTLPHRWHSLAGPHWWFLAPNFCRKPTGECYTEFETAEAAAKALKEKQHEHMGSRYIE